MKIHYYIQFFAGEHSSGSQQPIALARLLAERGHDVRVLSADYNVYSGQPEEAVDYHGPNGGSLKVLRFRSPRGGRGSLGARLKSYVAFMFTVWRAGLRMDRPDVILGSIQPLFTGWAALQVARRKHVPFVLQVRDLWPDALEAKGAVTGWKVKPLYWMANQLYRHAHRIVSVTPGIKKELVKKGIAPNRIDVFPNGFDPALLEAGEDRETVRRRYGWGTDFVAIYTGSFTEVTAVEVIVHAASHLQQQARIRFELFGSGPAKPAVIGLAEGLGLKNIHFHDPVPKREVPSLLVAADVALMCLFRSPLVHIYFENKFIDYMGAGKPILAAMEGEQADLIIRQRTGCVVPTFDDQGLAQLITEAADRIDAYACLGDNGQRLVRERFLLPTILARYADMLEAVATGKTDSIEMWEP